MLMNKNVDTSKYLQYVQLISLSKLLCYLRKEITKSESTVISNVFKPLELCV